MQPLKCFVIIILMLFSATLLSDENESNAILIKLIFENKSESHSNLWTPKVSEKNHEWAYEYSLKDTIGKPVEELDRKSKVGVALAGGVVRGIAHIGVLRAFEENNIPIDAIAGTSMGAIISGMYACGYSPDSIESIVMNGIDWKTLFSDLPPRQYQAPWVVLHDRPREPSIGIDFTWGWWPPKRWVPSVSYVTKEGFREAQKFTDEIASRTLHHEYRAGFDFDELHFPYGAALANLKTGKTTLMRNGTISTAARASASIPIVFEPMRIRDTSYVDGGVLDNLPLDAFNPFDPARAPKNSMKVIGEDTINFSIAVYPSKRREVRNKVVEKPESFGLLGIGAMNAAATLAREIYVWENWDHANAGVDIDVQGGFDFYPEKLKDLIRKGYDAALEEVLSIKIDLALKEDSIRAHKRCAENESVAHSTLLDSLKAIKSIHRISSIVLYQKEGKERTRVLDEEQNKKIRQAVRYIEGSYATKRDVCETLKRIYDIGDYRDVRAKIVPHASMWDIEFIVKRKPASSISISEISLTLQPSNDTQMNKAIENAENDIKEAANKYSRIPNYQEIIDLIEDKLVKQGFVAPHVESLEKGKDSEKNLQLIAKGRVENLLKGVSVNCTDKKIKEKIENGFGGSLNPAGVLEETKKMFHELRLSTISIEGYEDDKLLLAVKRKPNATIEFPSITIEGYEAIGFFGELRVNRFSIKDRCALSPYFNYAQNFPIKMAREVPRGSQLGWGFNYYQKRPYMIFIIPIPEINATWKHLDYAGRNDSTSYSKRMDEISAQATAPFYFRKFILWNIHDYAIIPGYEASWYSSGHNLGKMHNKFICRFRQDALDRIVFPETGWKLDLEAKKSFDSEGWWRAKANLTWVPFTLTLQENVTNTLFTRTALSMYSDGTPRFERYSMGGFEPIGSYNVRLYDHEALPGYRKDDFIESRMWKFYFAWRYGIFEMQPLGLKFNLHIESFMYLAGAGRNFNINNRLEECPGIGLHLDTSYLNVSLIFLFHKETFRTTGQAPVSHFMNHIHFSTVFYGLGF